MREVVSEDDQTQTQGVLDRQETEMLKAARCQFNSVLTGSARILSLDPTGKGLSSARLPLLPLQTPVLLTSWV